MEEYFNKSGEKKSYERITRVDYHNVPLIELYEILLGMGRGYLKHRHSVATDKVYWQKFLEQTDKHVIWMDYSQNINLTPKYEVQSAHFSGRQHTLHDALIRSPASKEFKYVYYIGDDTNQDSVMTLIIIRDIIKAHPEVISKGYLLLRSDNCSTQYKSRFVFQGLLDIAKENNIHITWFFGEAGHGRGLIDAMAWFGCEGPLSEAIIFEDKFFSSAQEMVDYLGTRFMSDVTKEYFLLVDKMAATQRAEGRQEYPIRGCQAEHVLSFNPQGCAMIKNLKDYVNEVDGGDYEEEESDVANDDNDEEENDNWILTAPAIFETIEEDSFVAIRAPPSSMELFYVMKVLKKGIATTNLSDSAKQHFVVEGEPYIIGKWVSFISENRKYAQYKLAKNVEDALINMKEIVFTDIKLNEKLQLDISEYHTLCCCAFLISQ